MYKYTPSNLCRFIVYPVIFCCLICCAGNSFAQKYAFTHYDIQDGLIQSQANALYQDNTHRLWIGTLGGVSRFDGKEFYSISRVNGLVNNSVYSVFADTKGRVWFGTLKGLSCLENQKIYNYPLVKGPKKAWVNHILEDGKGLIWLTMGNRLYKISGHQMQWVPVGDTGESSVTTIAVNKAGTVFASVYGKGIYALNNGKWQPYLHFTAAMQSWGITKMMFDRVDQHKAYLLYDRGIVCLKDTSISHEMDDLFKQIKSPMLSMELDAADNLWIGTTNGAYYASKQRLIHFTESNGLSDIAISAIYNDADNNLWLATQGNGIFKYEQGNFVIYERTEDTKVTPIVMSIVRDADQHILLGTDGHGLMKFEGNKITTLWQPEKTPYASKIQCLYADHEKRVWIGTFRGGIWLYEKGQFKMMAGTENSSIISIKEDEMGTIWLSTSSGLYYFRDNTLSHVNNSYSFVTSLLIAGRDSVLLGTQEGVMLVVNKQIVPDFKLKQLSTSSILSMLKYKGFVFFGTDDRGLYIWDQKNQSLTNYSEKDGLKSNSIYSIINDKYGYLWLGTGRGVNRLLFKPETMLCTVMKTGESKDMTIESNQNAILCDGDRVLVGTTKGLTVFNSNLTDQSVATPYIIINSVKLFPAGHTKNGLVKNVDTSGSLTLPYDQNHISISYLGVFLKNPESVTYQYKLTGLDDKFCMPMKNNEVDYPSLPPGQYTFEVKALNADGVASKTPATFNFEITPPFYQTITFRVSTIIFFILLGIVLQNSWHYRKIQRQYAIEAIKREEKIKIRQQTAEDFHDDLGNKLTRITILSDILHAKLDKDKTEQRNLVEQIKQNAAALYNGTKDILWALDPKSDNLYETFMHIKDIGIELFQDTPINFHFDEVNVNLKQVKLPMEYSRNINMIFKELLNNVLKHADAKNVTLGIDDSKPDEVKLRLNDDGKGFDAESTARGHGLNNIAARTKRIGGTLNSYSKNGMGTAVELVFRKKI